MKGQTLKDRIKGLLERLGNTPEAIAAKLRRRGIKGKRSDGRCCVLANLIKGRVPEAQTAFVNGPEVYLNPTYDDAWVESTGVPYCNMDGESVEPVNGHAIDNFIQGFDAGVYPDLVEEVK